MPSAPPSQRRWPGGLVGTYALYMMRERPIYGGELTRRIDDLTRGAWRPGAGAIYPILQGLVRRGDARVRERDGRKVYAITVRGSRRLEEVRRRIRERGGRFAELRHLVLDMMDPSDRAEIALDHLRSSVRSFVALSRSPGPGTSAPQRHRMLIEVRAELRRALKELAPARPRGGSRA